MDENGRYIEKKFMHHPLLDTVANLRPIRTTSKPKTRSSFKQARHPPVQPNHLLITPPVRLRLEEALENAQRNRQTHVFSDNQLSGSQTPWRSRRPISAQESGDAVATTMTHILQPSLSPAYLESKSISLRGEESQENRLRGMGSLSLKQIDSNQSRQEAIKDVHLRCPTREALENLRLGQQGSGARDLLDQTAKKTPNSVLTEPSCKRSVNTPEARANWERDRIKEASEMSSVLNQGWSDKTGISMTKTPTSGSTTKHHRSITDSFTSDPTGSQMAAILNSSLVDSSKISTPSLPIAPRIVTRPGAPNAGREGAAMAERFGMPKPNYKFATGDEEVSESLERATWSLDMQPSHLGPKAKLEGLEYAKRGQGLLDYSKYHAIESAGESKPVARIKPEAEAIAKSNSGNLTRQLLTNYRLPAEAPKRQRSYGNTRGIQQRSQGNAAKSCLNPKPPKWNGKVRLTRTSSLRRHRS